ncbi:MAG: DUF2116 family Zn-ribbon domain-containing protein [Firmicutes bacterium]|nr:DUF2116 family Zn-ribbon domain-containing protein [Bacillota bacterium]
MCEICGVAIEIEKIVCSKCRTKERKRGLRGAIVSAAIATVVMIFFLALLPTVLRYFNVPLVVVPGIFSLVAIGFGIKAMTDGIKGLKRKDLFHILTLNISIVALQISIMIFSIMFLIT